MKTLENQKIKTFLPVFSGFYNTVWQYDDENVLYNINEDRKEKNLLPIEWDNMNINYNEYETDISERICHEFKNLMNEFVKNITFENVYNPKAYNFSTDSINCIIEPNIDAIRTYLYKNISDFREYLKNNYTSYDGFLSSYSNQIKDWENDTKTFTDFSCNGHCLGSILNFIYYNIGNDELELYQNVICNFGNMEYVENLENCYNTPICNECNAFIKESNILNDINKYHNIMGFYPSKVLCSECLENI